MQERSLTFFRDAYVLFRVYISVSAAGDSSVIVNLVIAGRVVVVQSVTFAGHNQLQSFEVWREEGYEGSWWYTFGSEQEMLDFLATLL